MHAAADFAHAMTLLFTALSDEYVVQVSDRRLTRNGNLYDDEANKGIYVGCADATFSIAYTGLGEIGGQRTDEWVVDYLASTNAGNLPFRELFKLFHEEVASRFSRFRRLGDKRRISFVFAGFGDRGPFLVLLSNTETFNGPHLKHIDDSFQANFLWRNDKPIRWLSLMVNGTENALSNVTRAWMRKACKRYLREDPKKTATMFVQFIRIAARHPKFGHYVGKNCMSVIVTPSEGSYAQYHPALLSPISYGPHVVFPGIAFKDVWFSRRAKGDRPL